MAKDIDRKQSPASGVFMTALAALFAVVVIVVVVRGRKQAAAPGGQPGQPDAPRTTRELVNERMGDRDYRALLSECQAEQNEIARQSAAVQAEISGWVASHEDARGLSRELDSLQGAPSGDETEIAALRQRLEALMRADPEGKALLERRDGLKTASEKAREKTAGIIGARIRLQTGPRPAPRKAP